MLYFDLVHGKIQRDGFLDSIPQLIEELPNCLDISKDVLDKSRDSLYDLDKAILRKDRELCTEPSILLSILAYVAEVIRQKVDGVWELRPNSSNKMEPWIKGKYGEASLFDILYYVYEQLTYTEEEYFFLSGVAELFVAQLNEKNKKRNLW
jgi:hypothetical protein